MSDLMLLLLVHAANTISDPLLPRQKQEFVLLTFEADTYY